MTQTNTVAGQDLREMLSAASSWLEKSSAEIDALNVFPVPDGDTGTNMMLTMRSTMEEAYRAPDNSASGIANAMAKGALMGARGNSGVILSQIWRGLAKGLEGKESFTAADLASSLQQSAVIAYKGVSNPVEGTMLTVMKEAAAPVRTPHGTSPLTETEGEGLSEIKALAARHAALWRLFVFAPAALVRRVASIAAELLSHPSEYVPSSE